jgi:hypothetical protein
MKLTKGKISKLYNVKKQSLKKNRNRRKCKDIKTFRNKKPVNLANRTLKDFENIFKGGISRPPQVTPGAITAAKSLTEQPSSAKLTEPESPLIAKDTSEIIPESEVVRKEPLGSLPKTKTEEHPLASSVQEPHGATPAAEPVGTTSAEEPHGATPAAEPHGATPAAEPLGTTSAEEPLGTTSAEEPHGATPAAEPLGTTSAEEPHGATPAAEPLGTTSAEEPLGTTSAEEPHGATPAAEPLGTTSAVEPHGTTPAAEPVGTTQEALRPGVPVIPHQQEEEEMSNNQSYGENEMNQEQSHSNYGQGQNNYGQDDYQNSNSYGNNSSSSMMGSLSNYMSSRSGYGQNNFDENGSSYGYGQGNYDQGNYGQGNYGQNNYGQNNYGQGNYGQGMGMGPTYSETDQSSSKSNTQGVSQSVQTILDYLGNTIADKVVGRMSESGGQQNGFNALNASNNTMGNSSMGNSSMGNSSMGNSSMYDSSQYGGKKHTRKFRMNCINKTRRNKLNEG